jgi:hypothetical protein
LWIAKRESSVPRVGSLASVARSAVPPCACGRKTLDLLDPGALQAADQVAAQLLAGAPEQRPPRPAPR